MGNNTKTTNTLLNISLFIIVFLLFIISYSVYLKITSPKENESSDVTGRIIQVRVLNGTQIDGLAREVSNYLRTKNLDVLYQGNYSDRNLKNTFIIDHTGDKTIVKRIIRIIGISPDQVVQEIQENSLADITIVLGEDYRKLKIELKK